MTLTTQDRLLGTDDPMEWAKALVALMREANWTPSDDDAEGWLVGWFANAMETAEKLSATRKVRSGPGSIAETRSTFDRSDEETWPGKAQSTFSVVDRSDEIRAAVLRSRNRGWNARLLGASDLMVDGDSVLSRAIVLDVASEIGKGV